MASARIPAVWSLHRIQSQRARGAVREFLNAENSDVRAAAIHSVALWRDRDALKPLIELLSHDDPQLRRLAAMALGRIGESEAVEPLLDSYSSEMDPFLRHAIIYAIYEIGDMQSLPANHLVSKQVRKMQNSRKAKCCTRCLSRNQAGDSYQSRSPKDRSAKTTPR